MLQTLLAEVGKFPLLSVTVHNLAVGAESLDHKICVGREIDWEIQIASFVGKFH